MFIELTDLLGNRFDVNIQAIDIFQDIYLNGTYLTEIILNNSKLPIFVKESREEVREKIKTGLYGLSFSEESCCSGKSKENCCKK